jgi:hypothetical protein
MNKDAWSKLSSIAEVVSSAAVLLTLVYLAIQTNQISRQTALNSAALLSAARQESLNAELGLIYQYSEVAALESEDFETLSESERGRLTTIIIAAIRIRESLWWQNQNGVLDDNTWMSYRNLLVQNISGVRAWRETWDTTKIAYDTHFVAEIDAALAQLHHR